MKSVALHNLGCKVNSYEMEVMQQKLSENGYKIVPFAPGADIYLINTCTVTNIADRKSRQMLHKAKKMNPDAVVIATGCYVQTKGDELKMDEAIDLAIGNNKKKDIVEILNTYLEEKAKEKTVKEYDILDINHTNEYEEMTLTHTAEHTRAYIKIQDGCNQFCSYCAIPFARGRVRSRKSEDVLLEVKGLVKAGYQEIVVTGIHLSSYGLDFLKKNTGDYLDEETGVILKGVRDSFYEKEYLLKLLKQINEIEGLKRIRIGSLEPRIVTRHFASELAKLEKICPHFHLSLQSGDDATLKRMNRHYTTDQYYESVELLREYFENPAITTDIITGFPGETEEEFENTLKYVKKVDFYEVHAFKYSKRDKTVAAKMPNQLTEAEKEKRSSQLIELNQGQAKLFRECFIGKPVFVLWEEEKEIYGDKYMVGHTPHYVLVAKKMDKSDDLSTNTITKGIPSGFLTDEILLLS